MRGPGRRQSSRIRAGNMAECHSEKHQKGLPQQRCAKKKKKKDSGESEGTTSQITDEGVRRRAGIQPRHRGPASSSFSSARPAAASPPRCAWSRVWRRSRAGELYIDGTLVNDVAPKDRDIAMVFQNYALYPHMTVYENMAFSAQAARRFPRTRSTARCREAAKILGHHPVPRPQAQGALRRPAPARRHRPRDRARTRRSC